VGASQAPYAYDYWIESVEGNRALGSEAPEMVRRWPRRPRISVLLHAVGGATQEQVARTIASVKVQYYTDWELILALPPGQRAAKGAHDDQRVIGLADPMLNVANALAAGAEAAGGDYLIPVRAGNLLSPSALLRIAETCQASEMPSIIYGDQDEIDERGRRKNPWFKPQWDAEMLLAQDYVSQACAIALPVARSVAPLIDASDEAAAFALALAASVVAAGQIVHVPHVLCHVEAGMKRGDQAARVAVVGDHLRFRGAEAAPGPFDTVRVTWPLPDDAPAVSIVIPTRDKVELLRACVDSVLKSTSYPNFELIIIDNGSTERAALDYLSRIANEPNVRVVSYDYPYNYSAINNYAATLSANPYLCLLNNDTEVIGGDWLTEMMRYAVRPDVGAVGAKLLYDDGTIQHAGVIIGTCEAAGHAHRFQPSEDAGYFAQPHIAREVSAVTAACLVVEKPKFEAVGGLDSEKLAVAYNDVDLCLKLRRAGWRNIYVPHAVLLHHESKSRGLDNSPKNIERYMRELAVLQERWSTPTYEDPHHNKNLDRYSETFILRY
jgi:GT2 family glycosyltransferase